MSVVQGSWHFASKERDEQMCVCVTVFARVYLKPVMSPSKSSVHQIAWHVTLQAEENMLHWSPWVTLTKD